MADVVFVLIVIVFFGMAVALVAGCNSMLGDDAEFELDTPDTLPDNVLDHVVTTSGAQQ